MSDDIRTGKISTDTPEFDAAEKEVSERINFLINNKGTHSVDHYHKKLGKIMWDKCGMSRNKEGLEEAIRRNISIKRGFLEKCSSSWNCNRIQRAVSKSWKSCRFLRIR